LEVVRGVGGGGGVDGGACGAARLGGGVGGGGVWAGEYGGGGG